MDSISEVLSKYYLDYDLKKLPKEVLAKAKSVVLDYLGCAIGGANIESTKMVKSVFIQKGCQGECAVIGDQKASCEKAAFINGVASHGLEVDDMSSASGGHPAVAILPAAIAMAEKKGSSGLDLLMSIIWGYDMMTRVGSAAIPDNEFKRGWHPTSTNGIFGATIAVAFLMKLDVKQMANALGIAGGFSSGNLECYADGSLTKRLNPGNASHGAIIACELAAAGYTGPRWIFEGKSGFLHAYTDEAKPELMLQKLDYTWFPIMLSSFKPYACCRYNHSPIDATLSIMKENSLNYNDIEEITIDVVSMALRAVVEPREIKYNPPNIVGAQFSLPYSVAVAVVRGRAFIEEYTEEMLHNPEVRGMMKKVKIAHTSKMDEFLPEAFGAEATIQLKDGRKFSKVVKYSKGDPENPLTVAELEDKFVILAKLSINSKERIQKIIETVNNLENLNITDLSELL